MRLPSPVRSRPRTLRATAVLTGAALAVSALAVGTVDPARAASTDPVVLGAPAYFASDVSGQWTRLLNLPGVKHIVVNDTSLSDATVRAFVDQAKAKGITSYAYVSADYAPTGAGRKTPQTIDTLKAAIAAKMAQSASIGGIFIDEVLGGSDCAAPAAFFRNIYQWFKATYPGRVVVLNPGTALCSEFADTGDIFLLFESNRSFYYSAFKAYLESSAFDWIRALPNERVWMIMYGVTSSTFQQDVNDMASTAGVVWVDADTDVATVYDNLPDATMLSLLAQRAVPGSASVTVSTNVVTSSPAVVSTAVVTTAVGGAPVTTFPPVSTFPSLTQLPGPVSTTTTLPVITSPTLPILQAPATTIRRSVATRKVTTTTKRKATIRRTTKRIVRR